MTRVRRVLGVALSLAVALASLGFMVRNDVFRGVEAQLAAWTMGTVFGMDARAPATSGIVVLTDPSPHGLMITPDCTAGFLVGLVGLTVAPLFLAARLVSLRTLAGLSIVWAVIVATNLFRLGSTALAVQEWGLQQGLLVGHDMLGTLVTTVGTSLSGVIALAAVLPWHTRTARGRERYGPA